jgi:hypothetical protein
MIDLLGHNADHIVECGSQMVQISPTEVSRREAKGRCPVKEGLW